MCRTADKLIRAEAAIETSNRSKMSDDKVTSDGTADSELNDLLDSALEDFDKPAKTTVKDESPAASTAPRTADGAVDDAPLDETWSQDFIKQAADQFEKNLQNLMQNGGDGDFGSSLQKMAQSVANAVGTTADGEGDGVNFQAAIAQALKDLSATSENLQNATPGITEADLTAMFGQVNLDEGAGDIMPFMQGMMESLLSKEILYPSLKDLVDKFPAWLEEKKTTLPADELQRYNKQHELIQKVCAELEKEKESDSTETKKQRFDTILSLMQEMQNYGQPPEELVAETPALFQFDPEGNPVLPALPPGVEPPQNCSIM